ncbi:hypothetical protein [Streptomyces avermitilis]|uniref:hypothetical protein n=1 Tax=Streptomyces avermitilis TaxID=33903 RepID=UPI0010F4535B|nr:hypothetical protein [Streptomyces avermitilis]
MQDTAVRPVLHVQQPRRHIEVICRRDAAEHRDVTATATSVATIHGPRSGDSVRAIRPRRQPCTGMTDHPEASAPREP